MLTAIAAGVTLTNQPPSPGVVSGGKIDQCFKASPSRLVLDVLVATAVGTALLYRWNEEHSLWVPSAAGAASLVVGVNEVRWDTSGIDGYYCLRIETGGGTATYSIRKVPQ
jgi:hypothetical protein